MKIAVFSDSHGNIENMRKAILSWQPDQLIHLGDCCADARAIAREFPLLPMANVRGNCDYGDTAPEDRLFDLEGLRFFIAHGHRHNVKMGLDSFGNSVCFSGSNIGLFGHTHRAQYIEFGGMVFMNPGSVGDRNRPTYGQIIIENGEFHCEIVDI